ncbi:MAG: hypothetical protein HYX26_01350 [Acidobacteriales bacterium]|nr:hypothetical protein [Terriglobales bacterium]
MQRTTRFSLATILGAALFAAPAIFAQDAPNTGSGTPPPPPAGERRGPNLNLTEQQKQQMETFRKEQRAKLDALRADTTLTEEQKREQMRSYREQFRTQMESILTPEQKQRMKKWKQEHKGEGMRGGKHGKRGHRGPDQGPPPDNE